MPLTRILAVYYILILYHYIYITSHGVLGFWDLGDSPVHFGPLYASKTSIFIFHIYPQTMLDIDATLSLRLPYCCDPLTMVLVTIPAAG